jgi:hypothetical protein
MKIPRKACGGWCVPFCVNQVKEAYAREIRAVHEEKEKNRGERDIGVVAARPSNVSPGLRPHSRHARFGISEKGKMEVFSCVWMGAYL